MIGTAISHYRILEKLGEGGMGVVYKAEDLTLHRIVALKFLPGTVKKDSEEMARFQHEAEAISSLNHPHISTIHSLEEDAGQKFIVLEYIEGGTLKEKLKAGLLPIHEVVEYAVQIAEGLAHAHRKGIVHRDLKSDNIMLTAEGKLKITDFGLAKLHGMSKLTKTGSTVGTAAYMSPEQARGEEVDHRSDIFSFGVVLYELISGQLPFKGVHEAALMYEIVNESPKPLKSIRSEIPDDFQVIVDRSLAKEKEKRYQSADVIIEDLKAVARASDAGVSSGVLQKYRWKKRIKHTLSVIGVLAIAVGIYLSFFSKPAQSTERIPIAVADFINETNEDKLESLSGLLITSLEQSRQLSVLTRSGMFDALKMMGKENTAKIDEGLGKEICNRSNIKILVIPTIRKLGVRYTIDVKLLDPGKSEYLYSIKKEGAGEESITGMIDKIAEGVRLYLREERTDVEQSSHPIVDMTTVNLVAYQHYFRGEQQIFRHNFEKAEEEYRKAVALDSTFGLAYYRLAELKAEETSDQKVVRESIDTAFQFIDRIPEKERRLLRSLKAYSDEGPRSQIRVLKEAENITSDDKEMTFRIGTAYEELQEYDSASVYLERAWKKDSSDQRIISSLLRAYGELQNMEKVCELGKRVEASADPALYYGIAYAWFRMGILDSVFSILERGRLRFSSTDEITTTEYYSVYVNALIFSGQYDRAEKELESLNESRPSGSISFPGHSMKGRYFNLSLIFYAYTGRYREAIKTCKEASQFNLAQKDTSGAGARILYGAQLLVWGWNKIDEAWTEAEKTYQWQPYVKWTQYWQLLARLAIYKGEFAIAENIARTKVEPLSRDRNSRLRAMEIYSIIESRKNNSDKALQILDSGLVSGDWRFVAIERTLYPLAESQLRTGKLGDALSSLRRIQGRFNIWVNEESWIHYPKTFYLSGKVYEAMGENVLARKSYETFLHIWRDADKDLIEYVDAKARLAQLKEVLAK